MQKKFSLKFTGGSRTPGKNYFQLLIRNKNLLNNSKVPSKMAALLYCIAASY